MKVKKKLNMLLTALLCFVLLMGVLPTAAFAADLTYDISKSKTATQLNTET